MADTSLADFWKGSFGACIDHEHRQVGPCVYCKPCGRRLYQGLVMTAQELDTVRETIALADSPLAADPCPNEPPCQHAASDHDPQAGPPGDPPWCLDCDCGSSDEDDEARA
jgi:hypothetical protein